MGVAPVSGHGTLPGIEGIKPRGAGCREGRKINPQNTRRYFAFLAEGAAHLIQDFLLGKPTVTVLSDDVHAPTVRDATISFLRRHPPLRNTDEVRIRTGRDL